MEVLGVIVIHFSQMSDTLTEALGVFEVSRLSGLGTRIEKIVGKVLGFLKLDHIQLALPNTVEGTQFPPSKNDQKLEKTAPQNIGYY